MIENLEKMLVKYLKAILIFLAFSNNVVAQNMMLFLKELTLFTNKYYDSAKSNYFMIYSSGMISKELFLNLGNSYFKLDSPLLYYFTKKV